MRRLPCSAAHLSACYVDAAECFDFSGQSNCRSFAMSPRWNGSRPQTEFLRLVRLKERRVFKLWCLRHSYSTSVSALPLQNQSHALSRFTQSASFCLADDCRPSPTIRITLTGNHTPPPC
ncbi:hypothetical protein FA13DRAFT_55246 [Coprinellus micaceus]|uniref:Uncharacterized protein n=1 Tax=Coprinellus micaceus TaxID=71717 RepID=A0A4Y7U104_COPMI|nr:hypothetical protein FA13DRAFT_55246 [Coprinellus micaceus]